MRGNVGALLGALLLLSGCYDVVKTQEIYVGDAWVELSAGGDTFEVQQRYQSTDSDWQDAEAQCRATMPGARLPRSQEYRIMFEGGWMGLTRPVYREWFRDDDGTVGVFWVGDANAFYSGTTVDDFVAFRCVIPGIP